METHEVDWSKYKPNTVVENEVLIIGRGQQSVTLTRIDEKPNQITLTYLGGKQETFIASSWEIVAPVSEVGSVVGEVKV